MKKFVILLVTVLMVAGIVFAGCAAPAPAPAPTPTPEPTPTPAPTPEPTPEPTPPPAFEVPPEPAGFPQPNPLWGLGFKPDGTQYNFPVLQNDLTVDYWMVAGKTAHKILTMAGAHSDFYDASWGVETQVAQMEDVIEKGVDAIYLYPTDTAGTHPVVDAAGAAGIPVFNCDVSSESDNTVSLSTYDQSKKGAIAGEMMIEVAERMDEHLYVYELWCPMGRPMLAT